MTALVWATVQLGVEFEASLSAQVSLVKPYCVGLGACLD
jgi:hypothetical protein